MTTHIMALTYEEKIEAVKAGTCRQSVRDFKPARPKFVGEELLLHTWAGKPYRSKWDWRLRTPIVETFCIVKSIPSGWLRLGFTNKEHTNWCSSMMSSEQIDDVARRDCVVPSTGAGLEAVLRKLNQMTRDQFLAHVWEVIRW
jgi:hypothetical protein